MDKDNTHFKYVFECDKVIDGTDSAMVNGHPKLVLLRKTGKKERLENAFHHPMGSRDEMETIAVFNSWSFWRLLDKNAKKCFVCGKYELVDKNGLCRECHEKLPERKEEFKPVKDAIRP